MTNAFDFPPPERILQVGELTIPELRQQDDGYGNLGDSADCVCLPPFTPKTLREFILFVNNPEDVEIWFRVYKFNTIFSFYSWSTNCARLWAYYRAAPEEEVELEDDYCHKLVISNENEFLTKLNNCISLPRELLKIIWNYHFDILDCPLISGEPIKWERTYSYKPREERCEKNNKSDLCVII